MNNHAIECENLTVAYGAQTVLHNVSLDIPHGILLPLVGPNGAGKTTLMKAILGLVPLRSGRVALNGNRSRPAYVPQQRTIDPIYPVTVRRIVETGLYPRLGIWRQPGKMDRARIDEMLDRFGLLAHQRKTFAELSGGMKQKTLLARAFVSDAETILLDEPTSELDEHTEQDVLGLFREISGQRRHTLVVVHHGLHQAANLAETLCWVEHGTARMMSAKAMLSRGGTT